MIFAEHIAKSYGRDDVLVDVSFAIGESERVGLVGPNGAGKSTLMEIIAGAEQADAGRAGARGGDFGFLQQEAGLDPDRPLVDELWTAFPEAHAIEADLTQISHDIESGNGDLDELIERQSALFERFEALDGYRIDQRIGRVLAGLGFAPEDRLKLCGAFSGGWQMRAALAKVLVHRPPNLMLDEPTNHLDGGSRDWLALELSEYKGAVLLVTHDTEFHDVVVNRILELKDGRIESYTGNYSDYQRQKAEKIAALDRAAARQDREIARQTRFIERFRAKATKATAVKSREKAVARIDRVEREREVRGVSFELRAAGRTERDVLKVSGLGHTYGDNIVLAGVDLEVERGQRVVLVGPNGQGKSTLLKIIAGKLEQTEGRVRWADRARLGYYDQHQDEALEAGRTVLEEVRSVAGDQPDSALRAILGRFLFTGDDVFKPVSVLSGGERSRVALAKFLIEPSNVLLLDEPTNHLDVASRRRLIQALEGYDGTVIIASHDTAILERVATRVYHVENGDCVELEEYRKD
ncbi:MAG: ABC-F family ATP-binding cassette domain-containing protein [Chloroflexi bacterium]|nr:ABC-F family ATP-binding cassette domain-containing protein [Chloroflexota bacterium]MDA1240415.1 ABC-F family ATP-binding cassette domain-containing protein [Chloroflexota bacterium]